MDLVSGVMRGECAPSFNTRHLVAATKDRRRYRRVSAASLCVTLHNEGNLAWSAIHSAHAARSLLQSANIRGQAIIACDNPDYETVRTAKAASERFGFELRILDLGDVGAVRNLLAQESNGDLVCYLDGDDVWDPAWPLYAVRNFEEQEEEESVMHTAAMVYFGSSSLIRLSHLPSDSARALRLLSTEWAFGANTAVPPSVVRRVPFRSVDLREGLGHEDWAWTLETIDAGVRHVICDQSAYFARIAKHRVHLTSHKGIVRRPTGVLYKGGGKGDGSWPSESGPFALNASYMLDRFELQAQPTWLSESVDRASMFEPEIAATYDPRAYARRFSGSLLFSELWRRTCNLLDSGRLPTIIGIGFSNLIPSHARLLHQCLEAFALFDSRKFIVLVEGVSTNPIAEYGESALVINSGEIIERCSNDPDQVNMYLNSLVSEFRPQIINAGHEFLDFYVAERHLALRTLRINTTRILLSESFHLGAGESVMTRRNAELYGHYNDYVENSSRGMDFEFTPESVPAALIDLLGASWTSQQF